MFTKQNIISSQDNVLDRMFRIAFFTTCVIELSQVGASLIDGIIISRFLGPGEMAGFGLAYPFYSIAGIISGCISVGMQAMCTREAGRGKIENINTIFSKAVVAGTLLSVLTAFIFIFFATPISIIFGARGDAANLLGYTRTYLIGIATGTPALVLVAILTPAAQLDNGNKAIRNTSLVIAAVDVVADILAARLHWGLLGIGLATSLSNYAGLIVLLVHFCRKDSIFKFRILIPDWRCMKEMTTLGVEKLVRRSINVVRPIILNSLIIAAGGSLAMSVMSVRNSVNNFVEIPGAGIAGAVSILTGIFYGEINRDDIQKTGVLAHRYNILCALITTLLTLLLAKPLAIFYLGKGNEGVPLMVFAFICMAIRSFFSNLTTARICYLQSLHKVARAQILTILLNLVCICLCAAILGKFYGAYGIMAAFPASEFVVLIFVYIYYAVKEKQVLPDQEDYMCLEESFRLGPEDLIDFPIRGLEEASLTAEQIVLFCKGHGFDLKRANLAGLCAEEMARNTIEEEFTKDNKSHTIDIRVILRGDDLILRFRDNCPSYNMAKTAKEIAENEDPLANPGIRIIQKTAKDISYYRTMETNTTIIVI